MSGNIRVTRTIAGDVKMLDKSISRSAADAVTVTEQLMEMSLNDDRSCSIDRVLSENCSSSGLTADDGVAEATPAVTESDIRCRTLDGLVSEYSNDTVSDHLPSLNVSDQLASADDDCDSFSVGNISSQQLSVVSGFNSSSVRRATLCDPACECCQDNDRSSQASHEWSELFHCQECSIRCSKHFAHDSLHVVLRIVRHFEVDCSVFCDASLTVVEDEIYLTKVMYLSHEQHFSVFLF